VGLNVLPSVEGHALILIARLYIEFPPNVNATTNVFDKLNFGVSHDSDH